MSNIKPFGIAEPFDKYVRDQIKVRQQKKAAGFGENSKTPEEIAYLTSQNAWIRCASSTDITDITRLTQMGFSEPQAKSLNGQNLAKRFVLFNGITDNSNFGSQRGGYNLDKDNLNTDALYGVGGLDFGQVPMPGITSFQVSHVTNGALRQASLNIVANNRVQYNIIDALYVRLGHTIFIEWGNNVYFDNEGKYQSNPISQTLIEDGTWFNGKEKSSDKTPFLAFAEKIIQKRQDFQGNYDAFMGKVVNFETNFTIEGRYEVKIDIISTGDVIEGLKVNSLTVPNIIAESQDENSDIQIASQTNESDIRNYLYCLNNLRTETESEFNTTGSADFVDLSTQDNLKTSIQNSDLQYIRIGAFLDFLEKYIIPHVDDNPLIGIDIGASSNMRIFPEIVSTDPSKCVINNPNVSNRNKRVTELFKNFNPIIKEDSQEEGIIGNIYFKITHLENIMEELVGDDPTTSVSLLSLLQKICDSINSCFGGYVNIQPSIDEKSNTAYLRDTLYQPNQNESESEQESEQEDDDSLIKIYGYTPVGEQSANNQASIVTGYTLKTSISNELSSQLSIGAAASNQSTAQVNPFFKALSKGFEDIYQSGEATDGKKELQDEKNKFFADCKVNKKKKTNTQNNDILFINNRGQAVRRDNSEDSQSQTEVKKERAEKSYNTKQEARDIYASYISDMFDIKGVSQKNRYFRLYEKDARRGASKMSLYINSVYQYSQKVDEQENKGGGASLIDFIPIELNLELDGISGLKIYNRVSIDTEFLPLNYPDVIDFVILGIGHSLQDNTWTTNIQTLSIPGRKKNSVNELMQEDRAIQGPQEEEPAANEVSDITFFAPTGDLPFQIRNDSKGGGDFGDSRGSRTHKGVDIQTQVPPAPDINIFQEYPFLKGRELLAGISPGIDIYSGRGTTIFSPIEGVLKPTSAGLDAILPGIKIVGFGESKGITIKIMYAAPDKSLYGRRVYKGQPIGNAVQIDLQPKYKGVTNHIHFEIVKNGISIDPQSPDLKFTIDPQPDRDLINLLRTP